MDSTTTVCQYMHQINFHIVNLLVYVIAGCLLRGGQNVSLLLREPKKFAPALKKSLSGGGDSEFFSKMYLKKLIMG